MHLARVRNDFEVSSSSSSTRSSSAPPPRQSLGNHTHIWASKPPLLTLAPHQQHHQHQHNHNRASHYPVSPGIKAASSSKARTTILFVPPTPGPPPLKHPSPVRPTGPPEYFDPLPPPPSISNNTPRVAICTRKTTVKTNTITISSKPLPPRPLPTPPVIDINEYYEPESPGDVRKEARRERITWAPYGLDEWDFENENSRRRATSETRHTRTPSIDLGPELSGNLNDATDVNIKNQEPRGRQKRGREMTRPSLRVQLPPPSVRVGLKRTQPRDNHALEFVIHADDVIPSEAPPRTIEISECSLGAGEFDLHLNSREGNTTPKVTLTIAGAIDWPDYLVDSFNQDVESLDSSSPKPKSNDLHSLEFPTTLDDVPSGSSENNRRRPVKRKPAPPIRVHSLPIALGEADSAGAYDSATVAAQLQNLFSSDVGLDISPPPRTSPDSGVNPQTEEDISPLSPNEYPVPPLLSLGFSSTTLPPRCHSSPPGAMDPQGQLPSLLSKSIPPKLKLLGPTTKDWRTLSSLDLTAGDELKIYLDSLVLIAGATTTTATAIDHLSESTKPVEFRLSSSSSYYPDTEVVATSARITSFSPTIYSTHSDLPSPSDYIPYPSPNFKYSLVPRPISGVAELPCEIPVSPNYTLPAPTPKGHLLTTSSPVINVGRLRLLTSSTQSKVQFLDVLLTAPSNAPKIDQEMPCRTTILKATRRVTFVRPPPQPPVPKLPGKTTPPPPRKSSYSNDQDRKHGSLLKSPMSINTALKIGSGKGLLNRENSRRIRGRGGTILRKRGKDIYLELVILGILINPGSGRAEFSGYEAFLNRLDGSLWFVLSKSKNRRVSEVSAEGASGGGVFDQWLANAVPRKTGPSSSSTFPLKKEKIVAVRWADGLDCVDPLRGVGLLAPGSSDSGGGRGSNDYSNDFICGIHDLHMHPHEPGSASTRGASEGLGLGATFASTSTSQYPSLVARQKVAGEFEIDIPSSAAELEGVEVYFGEGVEEEEDGWFGPEEYGEVH